MAVWEFERGTLPFWRHSDLFLKTTVQPFRLLMEIFFHTLFLKIIKLFQVLLGEVELCGDKHDTYKGPLLGSWHTDRVPSGSCARSLVHWWRWNGGMLGDKQIMGTASGTEGWAGHISQPLPDLLLSCLTSLHAGLPDSLSGSYPTSPPLPHPIHVHYRSPPTTLWCD